LDSEHVHGNTLENYQRVHCGRQENGQINGSWYAIDLLF
jgi:hypothetical protein